MTGILPSILLMAFVFSPKIVGPFRLGDLLLVAALPVLLPRLASWRKRLLPSWQRLYLVLLAWSSLVTVVTLASGLNERGIAAVLTVARLAEIGLLFLATADLPESGRRQLRCVAVASLIGLFAIGLVEFLEAYVRSGEYFVRVLNSGLFAGEANHLAGAAVILAAAAPATLPFALSIAAMTGSRTAMLAVIVLAARDWVTTRNHRQAVLLAALVALFLLAAPATHRLRFTELPSGRTDYGGPHVDRLTAWSVAIRETPIATGVGLGARPSSVYESAYVHLFAETGLPGLLVWLALVASLLRRRSDASRNDAAPNALVAVALLVLGMTANVAIIARIIGPAALLISVGSSNLNSYTPEEKISELE